MPAFNFIRAVANRNPQGKLTSMKPNFSATATVLVAALLTLVSALTAARADEKEKSPPNPVQHADARQAAQLVTKTNVVVLDIRTPGEFASGHIAGATNLDFLAGDFSEKLGKLDREKTYLVHCGTGRRSTNCLPQLARLGFTNVVHLDGGLKAWQAAGKPVEKK